MSRLLEPPYKMSFCLADVITSPSAVVLPFAELVALCRERGVLSVVDGAHAPGQLPLNLEQLNADFFAGKYVTILHLWFFYNKDWSYDS